MVRCNSLLCPVAESEMLVSYIKIHGLNLTSKGAQIESNKGNVLIKDSLFIAFDSQYCIKTAKPGI